MREGGTVFSPASVGARVTELLYLPTMEAAYERSFRARVTALPPGGVVLDRTLFYPTGGGQPCDLGALTLADGTRLVVEDVAKSGPSVIHRLGRRAAGGSALTVGAEVVGTIDWERRHRHMRAHTFQHLLSARLFAVHARRTRKASLSGAGGLLELEGPWPASLEGPPLVEDVGEYLARDLPVQVRLLPRTEYERDPGGRSGLVPLPPNVDPVRVVEIEAADRCPCGGTHVRRLGEIGPFEIERPRPIAGGGVRVVFRLRADAPPTPSA